MQEAVYDKGFVYEEVLRDGSSVPMLTTRALAGQKPIGVLLGTSRNSLHEQGCRPLRESFGMSAHLRNALDVVEDPIIRNLSGIQLTTGDLPAVNGMAEPYAVLELRPQVLRGICTKDVNGSKAREFLAMRGIVFGDMPSERFRSYWSPSEVMVAVCGADEVNALLHVFEGFLTVRGMGLAYCTGSYAHLLNRSLGLLRMDSVPLSWAQRCVSSAITKAAIDNLMLESGVLDELREAGKLWMSLKPLVIEEELMFDITVPFDGIHNCRGGLVSLTMLRQWANNEGPIISGEAMNQLSREDAEELDDAASALQDFGLLTAPARLTFMTESSIGLYLVPSVRGRELGLKEGGYSLHCLNQTLLQARDVLARA